MADNSEPFTSSMDHQQEWRESSQTLVEGTQLPSLTSEWQPPEDPKWVSEQHGDHVDEIEEFNVWEEEEFQWVNDMIMRPGNPKIRTNDQLYETAEVREWMQKITTIGKSGYFPLEVWLTQKLFFLPLFTDDEGRQYQIAMGCGAGSRPLISRVNCPLIVPASSRSANALVELKCRMTTSSGQNSMKPPKNVLHLGQLHVKRFLDSWDILEQTDYSVVVDADSTEMPVWIVASRKQLRSRPRKIPCLPIFQGLMDEPNREERYHDIACILTSVRRIGLLPSESGAPDFQESCDLVRRSRATVDPAAILQPYERLSDFVGQNYIPSATAWEDQIDDDMDRIPERIAEMLHPRAPKSQNET